MISYFPQPISTTASVNSSTNYNFISTHNKISHSITQYSCDAGKVTAPPVLEAIEGPVLAAIKKL